MSSFTGNEIFEALSSKGIVVSPEWITQCLAYLSNGNVISRTTKLQSVVEAVIGVFLESDLYTSMDEIDLIPENVQDAHLVRLFTQHPRVLQIDEVTDVGSAGQRPQLTPSGALGSAGTDPALAAEEKDEEELAADRRAAAAGFQGPRHLLKVFLSDGLQQVVALDSQGVLAGCYQQRCAQGGSSPPSLHAFFAGTKVSVRNIMVRRGALMLTRDTTTFLGGSVHRLQMLVSGDNNAVSGSATVAAPTARGTVAVAVAVAAVPPTPTPTPHTGQASIPAVARIAALPMAPPALPSHPTHSIPPSTMTTQTAPVHAPEPRITERYAAPAPVLSPVRREPAPFPAHARSPVSNHLIRPPPTTVHSLQHETYSAPVTSPPPPPPPPPRAVYAFVNARAEPAEEHKDNHTTSTAAAPLAASAAAKEGVEEEWEDERLFGGNDFDHVDSPHHHRSGAQRIEERPAPSEMDVVAEVPAAVGLVGSVDGVLQGQDDMFYSRSSVGKESPPYDPFYDVPYTNDKPLLTGDLTHSPSPPHPKTTSAEQEMSVDHSLDLPASSVPPSLSSPIIASSRSIVEHVSTPQAEMTAAGPCLRLSYWDQILSEEDQRSQDVFLVRGITNRVTRLKTTGPGDEKGKSRSSSRHHQSLHDSTLHEERAFQVHVELDDGQHCLPCAVSAELVERFLDMTAADHYALMAQLPSKQEKRQAQMGIMNRFQHFHGLFWACRRAVGGGTSSITNSEEAEGEPTIVLIDFALDEVTNVCANMMAKLR